MNSTTTQPIPAAIQSAAHHLAVCQRKQEDAQADRQTVADEADLIRTRLNECDVRRADIRTKLAGKELSDKEAGGLLSLVDQDRADLETLLIGADEAVTVVDDALRAAGDAVRHAQAGLDHAKRIEQFGLLQGHVREIEAVYVASLAELGELSRAIGNPPGLRVAHDIAPAIREAVTYDMPPRRV